MPTIIKCILGDSKGSPPAVQTTIEPENEHSFLEKGEEIEEEREEIEEEREEIGEERERKKNKKLTFFKYSDENYWRPYLIYRYE